ncbi:hypothetical protein NECAME_18029 [Necator americanus]|uniref:Uncharacterized protein n=1 Tax=Necator americanus TaxID=51031 RepID=W2TGB4_NECAM|nr:hypothetical protein NECAME_18029 [Necator americanus]ETN80226.1 hypothetical protein NECAME_18029 [Necator americanus]
MGRLRSCCPENPPRSPAREHAQLLRRAQGRSGHRRPRPQGHQVRFLKGLADLAEKRNAVIKVYAVSEIDPGPTARVHYHYCMNSTVEVVQHAVKTVWDRACPSWPTIVHHEPPRSLIGASKYMMKDMVKPGFIRLFRRKTLRITWGNISGRGRSGFYTTPKEDLWRQFNEKIKRTSRQHQAARPGHLLRPAIRRFEAVVPLPGQAVLRPGGMGLRPPGTGVRSCGFESQLHGGEDQGEAPASPGRAREHRVPPGDDDRRAVHRREAGRMEGPAGLPDDPDDANRGEARSRSGQHRERVGHQGRDGSDGSGGRKGFHGRADRSPDRTSGLVAGEEARQSQRPGGLPRQSHPGRLRTASRIREQGGSCQA